MEFKKFVFPPMLYCCIHQNSFVVVSNKTSVQTGFSKKGMFWFKYVKSRRILLDFGSAIFRGSVLRPTATCFLLGPHPQGSIEMVNNSSLNILSTQHFSVIVLRQNLIGWTWVTCSPHSQCLWLGDGALPIGQDSAPYPTLELDKA